MTTTVATLDPPVHADLRARIRAGLLAIRAGVSGAAPRVLRHVGPLTGTVLAFTACAAIFTFSPW